MNPAIEQLRNKSITRSFGLTHNSAIDGAYAFSNENLRQYMKLLKIAGGRVATVGSSGDQAFYSVFNDAEEVTIIDANPYTKPMIELKMSAVKNMNLDEFRKYWSRYNVLREENYKDLLGDVSEDTREFLAKYQEMHDFGLEQEAVIKSSSWGYTTNYNDGVIFNSPYNLVDVLEFFEDGNKYRQLQSKLKGCKIKYKLAEFSEFPKKLTGKYSSILLSNIYDYYDNDNAFFDIVCRLIDKHMRKNSTMQFHYRFMGRDYRFEQFVNNRLDSRNCKKVVVESPAKFLMNAINQNKDNRQEKQLLIESKDYPREMNSESKSNSGESAVYIYEK